jgi:heat-inducible transcriptional repressor
MTSHHDFLDMDKRAADIFRHIVERFMADGEPVGSRTISRNFDFSPATARNIMSDLEELGLLQAPHVSAGRLPTDKGLRLFVDGILERGELTQIEQAALEAEYSSTQSINDMLEQTSAVLSGLSASAGLVVAPTYTAKPIRHIEFVSLASEKAMIIMVSEDGTVENRVIDVQPGITADMLREAGTFLSEKLHGRTIDQMREAILEQIKTLQENVANLSKTVIESGHASKLPNGKLIVHGRSRLLEDPQALHNIERLKALMEQLESDDVVSRLLNEASSADGVKIFIGAENDVFEGSGYSLILSPYGNGKSNNIVGAVGVIGPTRLNYAKIIPSVNYMAEMLSKRLRDLSE